MADRCCRTEISPEELSYPTGHGAIHRRTAPGSPPSGSTNESRTGPISAHRSMHSATRTVTLTARRSYMPPDGVRWIADPGGSGLHDAGPARQYLLSSRAHNVAIPDGREQTAGTGWVEADHVLQRGQAPADRHQCARSGLRAFPHIRLPGRPERDRRFRPLSRHRRNPASFQGLLHFDEGVAVAIGACTTCHRLSQQEPAADHSACDRRARSVAWQFKTGAMVGLRSLQGFVSHPAGGLQPANVLTYRFSGPDACGGVILARSEQGLRRMHELLGSQEIKDLLV